MYHAEGRLSNHLSVWKTFLSILFYPGIFIDFGNIEVYIQISLFFIYLDAPYLTNQGSEK